MKIMKAAQVIPPMPQKEEPERKVPEEMELDESEVGQIKYAQFYEIGRGSTSVFFPVEVLSKRKMFGRTQYKLKPVGGSGEFWLREDRVQDTLG